MINALEIGFAVAAGLTVGVLALLIWDIWKYFKDPRND